MRFTIITLSYQEWSLFFSIVDSWQKWHEHKSFRMKRGRRIKVFQARKTTVSSTYLIRNGLKPTFVNRTFKITKTVPLIRTPGLSKAILHPIEYVHHPLELNWLQIRSTLQNRKWKTDRKGVRKYEFSFSKYLQSICASFVLKQSD